MAKNEVIIKSIRNGFELILDEETEFDKLLELVADKFSASAKFFGKEKVALAFSGRSLSPQEERELIECIEASCEVEIFCLIDKTGRDSQQTIRAAGAFVEALQSAAGRVCIGTVHGGKVIESPYPITIAGDVNPGAKVICGGSVVVLGSVSGEVIAGAEKYREAFVIRDIQGEEIRPACFIAAAEFKSGILQIGEVRSKKPERYAKKGLFEKKAFELAVAKNDTIVIRRVDGDFNEEI